MRNITLPQLTPIGSFTTLHMVKLRLLKLLLIFGTLAVLGTWIYEAWVGRIILIDAIAYPAMATLFVSYFIAVQLRPAWLTWLEKLSFTTLAVYVIVYLQVIIFGDQPQVDIYSLATFAQWFPLVYTAAFIFLETRQATIISVFIYLSLLIPTLGTLAFGRAQWNDNTFAVLLNMNFSHPVYVVVLSGIAQLKEHLMRAKAQADIMSQAASIDHLTGAANRRSISQTLQQTLVRAQGRRTDMAVILLDIDNFKRINDTYGHDVGDQVLIDVADFLRVQLRTTDTLGRWGGEEFMIVAPDTKPAAAILLAERLRLQVAEREQLQVGHVTISFGVAMATPGDTPDQLVKRADEALYRAKQNGRNRVEMTSPVLQDALA
jgi:diguanylate cyclase (GGDEF)-like protein